jgi:hypothetical protein
MGATASSSATSTTPGHDDLEEKSNRLGRTLADKIVARVANVDRAAGTAALKMASRADEAEERAALRALSQARQLLLDCNGSVQDVNAVEALLDHALCCWNASPRDKAPCCALCLQPRDVWPTDVVPPGLLAANAAAAKLTVSAWTRPCLLCATCERTVAPWDRGLDGDSDIDSDSHGTGTGSIDASDDATEARAHAGSTSSSTLHEKAFAWFHLRAMMIGAPSQQGEHGSAVLVNANVLGNDALGLRLTYLRCARDFLLNHDRGGAPFLPKFFFH